MNIPDIVAQDEWLTVRTIPFAREKEFDRERDRLTGAPALP
jgi:predicted dithiol-disulfide oxidoreductase (DUF899 family)